MNKVKKAFDEQFGNLAETQKMIKTSVLNGQYKKKQKIHWQFPIIAAVILFVAAGFLWSQLPMNKENERLGTLSKQYFEVLYYDTFYLSMQFNRKAENYEQVLHLVLQQAAIIDYAKKKDIVVTEEETEALIKSFLEAFKEGKESSDMTAFRYDALFREFNLTDEKYAKLLAEQQLIYDVYAQRLFEKLNIAYDPLNKDYMQLVNDALGAFNGQYGSQINEMLKEFHPIPSKGLSGIVETIYTAYGEFQVVELEGELRFAQKTKAVDQLLMTAMDDFDMMKEEKQFGYLCYYTLDDYIKATKELAEENGKAKMEDLLELLTILKNTVELY
ncbi:hypothetical protein ACTHOQ_06020 [Solibacillus silvestris]|uniref:hypothetical protein n=1 Tax=Solibacillus silvestris TaxID=76853 RepID=UPI003F7E78BD